MKRVSVVILNWNGVDMLRKFIPSVMDNSVGEGLKYVWLIMRPLMGRLKCFVLISCSPFD